MSLGRARAMSSLAGEAGCSAQANKVPLSHRALCEWKETSWGVNGSCEQRAHPQSPRGDLGQSLPRFGTRPPCLVHDARTHAKRTPNEAQNMRCTSRNVDVLSYSTT